MLRKTRGVGGLDREFRFASMRPQRNAAENFLLEHDIMEIQACFNEAAA